MECSKHSVKGHLNSNYSNNRCGGISTTTTILRIINKTIHVPVARLCRLLIILSMW